MSEATVEGTVGLGTFEGVDVDEVRVEIRNAAGGLNDGLAIEPITHRIGAKVYLVLECDATGVNHATTRDGGLRRSEVLRATNAAWVDENLVRAALNNQAERIADARAAEEAQRTFAQDQAERIADMHGMHVLGAHADALVEECPDCVEEIDAEVREQEAERRETAQAHRGDVIEGSGVPIPPRRYDETNDAARAAAALMADIDPQGADPTADEEDGPTERPHYPSAVPPRPAEAADDWSDDDEGEVREPVVDLQTGDVR